MRWIWICSRQDDGLTEVTDISLVLLELTPFISGGGRLPRPVRHSRRPGADRSGEFLKTILERLRRRPAAWPPTKLDPNQNDLRSQIPGAMAPLEPLESWQPRLPA